MSSRISRESLIKELGVEHVSFTADELRERMKSLLSYHTAQTHLAQALDVSDSVVSVFLSGKQDMPPVIAARLGVEKCYRKKV